MGGTIFWDAMAYGPVKANSQAEVISKVVKSVRGGGGTQIGPALRKVRPIMKPRDIIVVFTDGY